MAKCYCTVPLDSFITTCRVIQVVFNLLECKNVCFGYSILITAGYIHNIKLELFIFLSSSSQCKFIVNNTNHSIPLNPVKAGLWKGGGGAKPTHPTFFAITFNYRLQHGSQTWFLQAWDVLSHKIKALSQLLNLRNSGFFM